MNLFQYCTWQYTFQILWDQWKLKVDVVASHQLYCMLISDCGIARDKGADRSHPPRGLYLLLSGEVCVCEAPGHLTTRPWRDKVMSAVLAGARRHRAYGILCGSLGLKELLKFMLLQILQASSYLEVEDYLDSCSNKKSFISKLSLMCSRHALDNGNKEV